MKDRIRRARKTLDLTQREFAERIGMKPNTIATYEMGRAVPSDLAINNICKEFNIREEWLRHGTGEMLSPSPTSELEALAARYPGMTHETFVLVEKLVNLPQSSQNIITGFLREVVAGFEDVASGTSAKYPHEMSREEMHTELDRQLDEEKGAAENASDF